MFWPRADHFWDLAIDGFFSHELDADDYAYLERVKVKGIANCTLPSTYEPLQLAEPQSRSTAESRHYYVPQWKHDDAEAKRKVREEVRAAKQAEDTREARARWERWWAEEQKRRAEEAELRYQQRLKAAEELKATERDRTKAAIMKALGLGHYASYSQLFRAIGCGRELLTNSLDELLRERKIKHIGIFDAFTICSRDAA